MNPNNVQELEACWYKSLEDNMPDYSVYDNNYYFDDLKKCWAEYSREYLLKIHSKKSLFGKSIVEDIGKIDSILDLGCGIGCTTASLKELFPEANVYGTNLKTTRQYDMAEERGKKRDFSIVSDIHDLRTKISFVFASEYFEHIKKPIDHLIDIIDLLNPTYFIIANSFNARAIGHFIEYQYNNEFFNGRMISRLFNKTLRNNGYTKVQTKLWNQRPTYWKKNEF